PTISLSKHGKRCRMIQNWHEHLVKLAFKKRNTAVLFNCCKKAAARIRWTPRASTTWACLIWSLSKSPKPNRTWNARWQLGFRSRLLPRPGGCSPKQKLNDEFCARSSWVCVWPDTRAERRNKGEDRRFSLR